MVPKFGRPVPQLSMITTKMTNLIYDGYHNKLTDLNQRWLAPDKLEEYAQAIHNTGAPLVNCWGFVDGTVRPICRPGEFQRIVFDGHHRVHALKFQSVATPN